MVRELYFLTFILSMDVKSFTQSTKVIEYSLDAKKYRFMTQVGYIRNVL